MMDTTTDTPQQTPVRAELVEATRPGGRGLRQAQSERYEIDISRIWNLLEQIPDPEIPVVSLRELGILRDVRLAAAGTGVDVIITPTYNGCPAMEQIEDDIRATLAREGICARVVSQLAPAWTTDWISTEAKEKLRAYGIAPPHTIDHACVHAQATGGIAQGSIVQFAKHHQAPVVPCPQCSSHNTTETSHFGSTACKALYRCLDCMEPFDYFKPY